MGKKLDSAPDGPLTRGLKRLNRNDRLLNACDPLIQLADRTLHRIGTVLRHDSHRGRNESRDA